MKKSILSLSVAAALFNQLPAMAAAPATAQVIKPAPAAKPAPSPRMQAFTTAAQELTDAFGAGKGNPIPLLDKLTQHQYSEATRAELMKHFGVPTLFTVKSVPAPLGKVAYTITNPAHRFMDANGEAIEWAALNAKVELDKEGRHMISTGTWPSLMVSGKAVTLSMSDMSLYGDQTRTNTDIWLGKGNFRIGKMTVSGAPNAPVMTMDNMVFDTNVVQRDKVVDVGYDARIQAVKMMGEAIDNFRIATRMTNVDMEALQALTNAMAKKEKNIDPAKAFEGARTELTAFGKSMAARGTAIEFDDISASYRGHKVQITGRVSLARMDDADFATPGAFAKKLIVRMDVRVPLALVTEIASTVTRKQAAAKGEPLSDAAVAQASQGITDAMVGKAVTSGFAKVENDALVTLLEMKDGKLTLNGKEVQLPKRPAPGAQAAPAAPAAKPAKPAKGKQAKPAKQ